MLLTTTLLNVLLASLVSARYVENDPKTCTKNPNKRDVGQDPVSEVDERAIMGGSLLEGRAVGKTICLQCCNYAARFCDESCRIKHSGAGAAFWAMAACTSLNPEYNWYLVDPNGILHLVLNSGLWRYKHLFD
ncbi:hypothetical protein BDP81DRAFT_471426 [Colletotrichum phormii]|uniref:Uncharacterized protein n=1 Tax=Colletotrichum phormii TaxID=359342 RepID=A0AAJ0EFS5_9PEZI|nr:uncharacterized protein BDP81DRAFT_471426 [Colletotrichum phormii]KAK1637328.1 hypothetical protein BDP81DRAFT_471426 [Colletotrichum phormii]